jgi:hypothetical protein
MPIHMTPHVRRFCTTVPSSTSITHPIVLLSDTEASRCWHQIFDVGACSGCTVAEVAFLVALGHGALKSSASSAAIGTQWSVSEDKATARPCRAVQPAMSWRHTSPAALELNTHCSCDI